MRQARVGSRQNKSRALSPEQALAVPIIARGGGRAGEVWQSRGEGEGALPGLQEFRVY